MPRESEKFTGILQIVQHNPVPVFGAKKTYQYHLTEIFHRNFRTNGKRSNISRRGLKNNDPNLHKKQQTRGFW